MIRLLLADDQPLLLSALRTILDAQDDITVVATAADGAEAVEKTRTHRINVAVLDIRMPVLDGITAARTIMEMGPRVIMLTTFDDDTLIHAAIDAGVHGFLLKDAEPDVLANAVRAVARGESVLAPGVTGRVMEWVRDGAGTQESAAALEALTQRERDVLAEIGRGATNAEIAATLFIAETTVKTHVSNLLAKLGARDRVALALIAQRAGISS
ncbi:response regulator transcription factor [Corynebacterium sp. UMB10321]|uniref:response regulator n=1 Tax=Corynebacterium sp. UMB10321 TaxID=3046312 RepID=UPI00254B4382|nr:response regulator transcription factor [Corynebacterium sp. UMB10321]MDK8243153.1 response regulator transcription factor [Corynebacterium sp. UMB10321]